MSSDDVFVAQLELCGEREQCQVRAARTAQEALAAAEAPNVHAAFVDLDAVDGFALARGLAASPRSSMLPLAFVSSDPSLHTRARANMIGVAAFLDRPPSNDSISGAMRSLLWKESASRQRVLLLDDDPALAAQLLGIVAGRGVEVRALQRPDPLLSTLDGWAPDVLMMDLDRAGADGLDVCRGLRVSQRWRSLPIFALTARDDAETRLQAYRAGVTDVLAKPVLAEELCTRIESRLEQLRAVRERCERDELSGLLLRAPFLEAADRCVSRDRREGGVHSICFIDIDHFKEVNDRYGHPVGDTVIARLGALMRAHFRREDLRCRWGGEEFLVLLPGQSAVDARAAVSRLLDAFRAQRFGVGDAAALSCSFTAGVASYPEDGDDFATLLRAADARLYQGKRHGRARVESLPPSELGAAAFEVSVAPP